MNYWTKLSNDMAMAADLKVMHKAKKIARQVTVYGPPDERGKREILGTETVFDDAKISRRDLHRFAMGR